MDQDERTLSGNDGAFAVQRTNLLVGKHGTQKLRGGTTKGREEYSEKTSDSEKANVRNRPAVERYRLRRNMCLFVSR